MRAFKQSACGREPGRGRAALGWAVLTLVVGQLALYLALNVSRPLRDPEYGLRLDRLRARQAERPPGRPLVLLLGSSRVAMGVRPGLLPQNRSADGSGPLVFNFGLCRSGPVMELLCLRRLLADGVRPDCVYIELLPFLLVKPAGGQLDVRPTRLDRDDWRTLKPYCRDPRPRGRRWADEAVPWLRYRTHLLDQIAPSWLSSTQRTDADWAGMDDWGWVPRANFAAPCTNRAVLDCVRTEYVAIGDHFAPSDDSRRALAELLGLCRDEKVAVVLLLMPDAFLPEYEPAGRARMDAFFRRLSDEYGAPLLDARDWMPPDAFVEGVHLTHAGAAAFTERFGREALPPDRVGEILARR